MHSKTRNTIGRYWEVDIYNEFLFHGKADVIQGTHRTPSQHLRVRLSAKTGNSEFNFFRSTSYLDYGVEESHT